MGYLDDWERSVKERSDYSKMQKKMMLLSSETLLGIKMTGSCIKYH